MRYITFFVLMFTSMSLFALKIIDNDVVISQDDKKNDKKIEKQMQKNIPEKIDEEPLENESLSIFEKKVPKSDYIMPQVEEKGRVLINLGLETNISFNKIVDNFYVISGNFEYNPYSISDYISVFGSFGIGLISDYFLLNLEAGIKYHSPRITSYLQPNIHLSLHIAPYFTSQKVYAPIAASVGFGFKIFINNYIAIEENQAFDLGGQANNNGLYFALRFRLGFVVLF